MIKFSSLDYVILVVSDLSRSVTFYQDVMGMPLKHRAAEYAQFSIENIRFGLYTQEAMAATLGKKLPALTGGSCEIGFKVDNVDDAYKQLTERGAKPITPPTTRRWGQRSAYIADPDDHLIELAQQLHANPMANPTTPEADN